MVPLVFLLFLKKDQENPENNTSYGVNISEMRQFNRGRKSGTLTGRVRKTKTSTAVVSAANVASSSFSNVMYYAPSYALR